MRSKAFLTLGILILTTPVLYAISSMIEEGIFLDFLAYFGKALFFGAIITVGVCFIALRNKL